MEITDILNCITSFIGLVVSIIAIIISVNTTRKQIKMDLFNKRYEFYIACDIICGCCIAGFPDAITSRLDLQVPYFNDYTIGSAEFLFDKETATLVETIYSKGMMYRDICYSIICFESGEIEDKDLYQECKDKKNEYLAFFNKARKDLNCQFKKYLTII